MELDELKKAWRKEQNELINRIEVNETKLNEITIKSSKSKLERYVNISILGKNLAFVYFLISLWFSYKFLNDYPYSITALLGGFAMLFSFFQHRVLKRLNFDTMSIIELQKNIQTFRVHSLKHSVFDKVIVLFWLLTMAPIYLRLTFRIFIFSNLNHFIIYLISAIVFLVIIKFFPFDIYKKWDLELKDAEQKLNQIKELELD